MCFEDDPNAEMTQIDLWKSYQGTFLRHNIEHPHLIAGDFIKNVSNTFTGASAQVAGQNKYVIRGIKPRATPIDTHHRELLRCQWHGPKKRDEDQTSSIFAFAQTEECGLFYPNGSSLLQHVLTHHLDVPRKGPTPPAEETLIKKSPLSRLDFDSKVNEDPGRCTWATCKHKVPADVPNKYRWILFGRHIETHIPDQQKAKSHKDTSKDKKSDSTQQWLSTSVDESLRDPCGVPLGAVLCLRNIARGLAKIPEEGKVMEELLGHVQGTVDVAEEDKVVEVELDEDMKEKEGDEEEQVVVQRPDANSKKANLIRGVFGPVKDRLFFVMGHNYVLKEHVGDVLRMMGKAGAC